MKFSVKRSLAVGSLLTILAVVLFYIVSLILGISFSRFVSVSNISVIMIVFILYFSSGFKR